MNNKKVNKLTKEEVKVKNIMAESNFNIEHNKRRIVSIEIEKINSQNVYGNANSSNPNNNTNINANSNIRKSKWPFPDSFVANKDFLNNPIQRNPYPVLILGNTIKHSFDNLNKEFMDEYEILNKEFILEFLSQFPDLKPVEKKKPYVDVYSQIDFLTKTNSFNKNNISKTLQDNYIPYNNIDDDSILFNTIDNNFYPFKAINKINTNDELLKKNSSSNPYITLDMFNKIQKNKKEYDITNNLIKKFIRNDNANDNIEKQVVNPHNINSNSLIKKIGIIKISVNHEYADKMKSLLLFPKEDRLSYYEFFLQNPNALIFSLCIACFDYPSLVKIDDLIPYTISLNEINKVFIDLLIRKIPFYYLSYIDRYLVNKKNISLSSNLVKNVEEIFVNTIFTEKRKQALSLQSNSYTEVNIKSKKSKEYHAGPILQTCCGLNFYRDYFNQKEKERYYIKKYGCINYNFQTNKHNNLITGNNDNKEVTPTNTKNIKSNSNYISFFGNFDSNNQFKELLLNKPNKIDKKLKALNYNTKDLSEYTFSKLGNIGNLLLDAIINKSYVFEGNTCNNKQNIEYDIENLGNYFHVFDRKRKEKLRNPYAFDDEKDEDPQYNDLYNPFLSKKEKIMRKASFKNNMQHVDLDKFITDDFSEMPSNKGTNNNIGSSNNIESINSVFIEPELNINTHEVNKFNSKNNADIRDSNENDNKEFGSLNNSFSGLGKKRRFSNSSIVSDLKETNENSSVSFSEKKIQNITNDKDNYKYNSELIPNNLNKSYNNELLLNNLDEREDEMNQEFFQKEYNKLFVFKANKRLFNTQKTTKASIENKEITEKEDEDCDEIKLNIKTERNKLKRLRILSVLKDGK